MNRNFINALSILLLIFISGCQYEEEIQPGWPTINSETKPWSRWWWHGNALTKEGITAEMEAYQKAGLGGLEITPIYGVLGYEEKFVNYLSPEWMELFLHTLIEAERLGMRIDMATGTGWPFGGPWVTSDDACKNMHYKIYELKGGEQLKEKIEFIQQPMLRAVGNQIYEVHQSFSTEPVVAQGTAKEPLMKLDPRKINIKDLVEPISANKNLQALALDQVQFEKPLKLKVLMGYNESGEKVNLTPNVDASGKLNWTAPNGNWKLYAVFEGWHGKMVERAGPGGEGNVIDHFSKVALQHYLQKFDSAFSGKDISSLRSFFNDSYEVDDARGSADFTPELFNEFLKRRGYDLREHLPALFAQGQEEKNKRVLCDYRETISELLLENFTTPWKDWAHAKDASVRNQAHGSPANILDLYATVDIPEIEGVEALRIKMASSAGNVTGKKLISSESATWLNEHFESNLSDIKIALDRFMLNGVNHIFYHGTSYSPPEEPWPGWLFYAAVHLNPRNSLWKDFDALNEYVARCQSFLQNSTPDNDVLLYYPVYDRYSTLGREMIEHFDGIGRQFENTAFERSAKFMLENGYAFDYISDKQIGNLVYEGGKIKSEGGNTYQALVIPKCEFMPIKTLQKVIQLMEAGAAIILSEGLPVAVSGFANLDESRKNFQSAIDKIRSGGRILVGDSLRDLLSVAKIRKESLIDLGIQFIRKKESHNRTIYFIANKNNTRFEGWLPLESDGKSVVIYDPMNGSFGKAKIRNDNDALEVFVQMQREQTLLLEIYKSDVSLPGFNNYELSQTKIPLRGKWSVTFIAGGPLLPTGMEIDSLQSWTAFGNEQYQRFSGTASYKINFSKLDNETKGWLLDLGTVKESAEVFLNGKSMGTLIGPVYQLYINSDDIKESNELEIQVSNLMANRIADLDKLKIFWRKFYNVNFPARRSENRKNGLFDASGWEVREAGLIGPVALVSLKDLSGF